MGECKCKVLWGLLGLDKVPFKFSPFPICKIVVDVGQVFNPEVLYSIYSWSLPVAFLCFFNGSSVLCAVSLWPFLLLIVFILFYSFSCLIFDAAFIESEILPHCDF